MPMPKRSSVDDFFAQLSDVQRPHLDALRNMSRKADPATRFLLAFFCCRL